jgi:hypothetical protein
MRSRFLSENAPMAELEMLKNYDQPADEPKVLATLVESPATATIPAVIADAGPDALERFFTFFTDTIRNPNTPTAYYRNARRFFHWCEGRRLAPSTFERPWNALAMRCFLGSQSYNGRFSDNGMDAGIRFFQP